MKLFSKTNIVAFVNQKGGCGKTTSAVNVAAGLARRGLSVTLVDTDPQCNATDSLGVDRDKMAKDGRFTVADAYLAKRAASDIELAFKQNRDKKWVLVEADEGKRRGSDDDLGLHDADPLRPNLILGHRGLGSIPFRLDAQVQATVAGENQSELDADDIKNEHRSRLRASLASLRGKRDVVVVDSGPDLNFLMTSVLIAADYVVIPVFPSGYDLKGLEALSMAIKKVRTRFNKGLQVLGVLIGNFDARAKLDSDIQRNLAGRFGADVLFKTTVHRSVRHREAPVYGKTIFEHAPAEPCSQQFEALSEEFVERLQRSAPVAEPKPASGPQDVLAAEEGVNG